MRSNYTRTSTHTARNIRSNQESYRPIGAHVHIERNVSIDPNYNRHVTQWLHELTRQNTVIKNCRNLGGLSITFFENDILWNALRKKHSGYGRDMGETKQIQKDLKEKFDAFVSKNGWGISSVALDRRLISLGQGGGQKPLCFIPRDKNLYVQGERLNDFMSDMRLDASLPDSFAPHITLTNLSLSLANKLIYPNGESPKEIVIDPMSMRTNATYSSK